ncbi:orotate phosphoribosyltransferase [Thermosulfuriphilus sp.]
MLPRERLAQMIVKQAFIWRKDPPFFRLSSGKESPFYFDLKRITLDPEGAALVGELGYRVIADLPVVGIGGMTFGADPIACAIMHTAYRYGRHLYHFSVRKEPKGHGTGRFVEGNISPGDRVVVVEDVVTTGGSTLLAVERVKEAGLVPEAILVLVDREEEGGLQRLKKEVPRVEVLFKRSELMKITEK